MSFENVMAIVNLVVTIVGLAFVIVGLWQTRKSINAATYQHILDREAENWDKVREGPISIRVQALRNFGVNITEEAYSSEYDVLLDHISVFNFYEGVFFQKKQGALNKVVWENWARSLKSTMRVPEFQKNWNQINSVYSPEFNQFIAEMMPPPAEAVPEQTSQEKEAQT